MPQNEKYVRKVVRQGKRSLSINIPLEIAKDLGIREKQKMVIQKSGNKITIMDWKNKE